MFDGVLTALVTPFRNGEIDEKALAELVELQIAAGVDGLAPCGSTGESATLSAAEHNHVVELVIRTTAGRVPVVAGTGSNNTRECIEFTRHAREAGADGALLISPYYNKPTQAGIVAHYEAIAHEVGLPMIVYNVPGRTASNMLPSTVSRLAECEQIVGIKEASGDANQIAHLIAQVPESFSVLSGDDTMTLALLALGGDGVISTTSNVAPAEMCELVRAFREGDLARARKIHYRLLPLFDALFCESNPIPLKAALALMGRIDDEIRLPLTRISPQALEEVQAALKEVGIL